jgi:hypothetical protein
MAIKDYRRKPSEAGSQLSTVGGKQQEWCSLRRGEIIHVPSIECLRLLLELIAGRKGGMPNVSWTSI